MGGIVNATIKSGTNSFHGDIWEFFRNNVLNANSWENKFNPTSAAIPTAPSCAGICLAAPWAVRSSRTSCSSSSITRASVTIFLPQAPPFNVYTTAERSGNFGALCPCRIRRHRKVSRQLAAETRSSTTRAHRSTAPCTPSSPAATNSPDIPVQQDSDGYDEPRGPGPVRLLASIRKRTGTGLQHNAVNYHSNAQYNVDQGDIKIDYQANDKDNISGRYHPRLPEQPSAIHLCA